MSKREMCTSIRGWADDWRTVDKRRIEVVLASEYDARIKDNQWAGEQLIKAHKKCDALELEQARLRRRLVQIKRQCAKSIKHRESCPQFPRQTDKPNFMPCNCGAE